MTTIHISQSTSTELMHGWEQIRKIEISSQPFNEGAFGEVFDCLAINDKKHILPLVIKLFKPDPDDNHRRGYETILKLQARVRARNQELPVRESLARVSGLYALPQFSFTGQWEGQTVFGYAARKLDPNRFILFEEILQSRFRIFRRLSWEKKLRLALDLTECFERLRKLNYIHADINPYNLFINLHDNFRIPLLHFRERHLVLIDYDSGVVVDEATDTPTTFGKKNEWLAPEVYEQEKRTSDGQCHVTVDLFTDVWAVAVGIHYLLFSRFPFFFLKVVGPQELRHYLRRYRWPEVDKNYPNFNPTQARVYDDYKKRFDRSDDELKRPFILTFNEGVYSRTRRVSYTQWTRVLRQVLDRQRSIRYGVWFIVLLLTVVVPFFHTSPPPAAVHHQRTAESDAEHAQPDLDRAQQAFLRGDQIQVEQALTAADYWDSARVAQFRRAHIATFDPLSFIPIPTSPHPGDLRRDELSGIDFIYLKGGCFSMGSPTSELGRDHDEGSWGRRRVCLEKGFWIATKEVTNAQYQRFYPNHKSGSYHGLPLDGADQPVVNISWGEGLHYLENLNQQAKERTLSRHYQFPTEAQWEYAARAGTTMSHFWGNDQSQVCRYANILGGGTRVQIAKTEKSQDHQENNASCSHKYIVSAPVGSFEPNPWGLYDMLGNVWEWTCSDYRIVYDGAEQKCVTDTATTHRVLRGGSWHDQLALVRAAKREAKHPDSRNNHLGFRPIVDFDAGKR
ncbi:hypothetical protein CCP3SC15_490006 [Gammaproteobacteria bacterium]